MTLLPATPSKPLSLSPNSMEHVDGRKVKIEEQLREIAAHLIERESNKTALITVTRAEIFERGRKATIYITVLPVVGEESALNFIKRKRPEIKDAIKKRMRISTIPFIDVAIDTGEKARQNIDKILYDDEQAFGKAE